MSKQSLEHQATIYRPEDIQFRDDQPYLEIILGQMVLELALKNVGSDEEPVWIAWFDPREEEVKNAGTSALIEMLGKLDNVALAITPFSSKSMPMITEACDEVELPLLDLLGSRDFDEIKAQTHLEDRIYVYNPITSPDKPKYMAFGRQIEKHIKSAIKAGEKIVIIDNVYSTGATIKAILGGLKDILGRSYDPNLIEVVTVAREGVIHNGDGVPPVDMEPNLMYDVFIPEVIGNLNEAIDK
ncbi:MAG: hypothetical protein OEX81_00090 [Candidatus Pacebacteria bacterium]|nr:hypothetical protein [Candidatus Paceibacterota bacterium]